MRVNRLVLTALAATLIISLLFAWFIPSIHDFMVGNSLWNGVRNYLKQSGARSVDTLGGLSEPFAGTALIIVPYLNYGNQELVTMKNFVQQGGTLMLMDDYGFGNQILEYMGLNVRFSGEPLLDPLFCYKNQSFPKITDFSPPIEQDGIGVVVFNHGTALQNVPDNEAVAWSSNSSFLDVDENGVLGTNDPMGPLAVAARIPMGKGTLVLVSDPSLIINGMVEKNGNLEFVKYLISPEGVSKDLIFDVSHLSKSPLDTSKSRIGYVKDVLSTPYSLLAIIIIIFAIVTKFVLMAGGTVERESKSL